MSFDPAAPHAFYVLAAYGLLFLFLAGFAVHAFNIWRKGGK